MSSMTELSTILLRHVPGDGMHPTQIVHYAQRFSIEQIADLSAMSRSTFHAHFKAVTTMTPLEYRSQLRVHEARRLTVAEALTAADAGFRVGYESASQFSRDDARILGIPPARDAQRMRANVQDATESA